jgi:hypothetical protein
MRFAVTCASLVSTLAVLSAQIPAPAFAPGQAPAPRAPSAPRTPGAPSVPGAPTAPGTPGTPEKGTSVLRGYVLAADTGNPLRRAVVRAMSQEGRNSGMTTTDAEGRFEIKELPGGRYTLTASKAGYVMMSYGQRRPEQQGTVLEILEGTTVEKIAFSLPRGGVITGIVLDEFGDPVAGAQVNALRFRYGPQGRRLMPSNGSSTDDRGAFRIYGLTPGDYYVSAVLRSPGQMMVMPGSSVSAPAEGYAPTYYPGTVNAAEASRVTVKAAEEATNISMALVTTRLARISGRAVNSRGAPIVQGIVRAQPHDRQSMMMMTTAMTGVDGSFQMAGVAPGTYNVTIFPRGMPGPDAEFANMRVTVAAADIEGVMLMTAPGAIARGTITTDEGTPPPVLPEQISLFAQPATPDPMPSFGPGIVNADWTFQITGLSEPRLIRGSVTQNPDWAIKSVLQNGQDVTDTPIEFVPGTVVEGLNIVLTRKLTELTGQVVGERNAPDTDATVIAFSDNPDRWTFGSRYIRTARPNQDGRYTLRGLPPHDYLIAAVKDIEPGQTQDPEFLESLRPHALRVSLSEGEAKVQDVTPRR